MDLQVQQALLEQPVLELTVLPEPQVLPEKMEQQVPQEHPAQLAPQVRLEQME